VRVIAGEYRGRPLLAPRGRATRPTSDRVREALFSILFDVQGTIVLDLFSGSGALAIESLSRGAAKATLVDSSAAAVAAIRRNLDALRLEAEVRCMPVHSFLATALKDGRQYDLVFVDPPYDRVGRLRDELRAALVPVLSPGARVVAESDRRSTLTLDLPLLTDRTYGDTRIQIYCHDPR